MASAQLIILHPDLFSPQTLEELAFRNGTLGDETFMSLAPTPPIPTSDLTAAGVRLLTHVQGLLDRHAMAQTRDLRIVLLPVYPNPDTDRFGGTFGEWRPQLHDQDQIWVHWSGQAPERLSVVTHEVGHHLCGYDEAAATRFPVANSLLHELTAEALVLTEHGEKALHYQSGPIRVELVQLLKDEQLNPLNEADISIFENLFKQDAVYTAAVTLLRITDLDISSVLNYTIPTFVPWALSHLTALLPSEVADGPKS